MCSASRLSDPLIDPIAFLLTLTLTLTLNPNKVLVGFISNAMMGGGGGYSV